MKTIDNVGLQIVKSIIIESISTSSIYCFGEKKKNQSFLNPFLENKSTKENHTHFYLLVLTHESIINSVADIADIIKTKTKDRYTVTLLLHKATSVRDFMSHQLYFYHQVLTKGYKVYEHENVPPNIIFNEIPKRKIHHIRSYWNNRNKIAEAFLRNENQIDTINIEAVQQSIMHTAVEQICLGLINVFLGYNPDHFSLTYLFDICEIFTPLTSDIFPRITNEDKKLFNLLKTHSNSLRWVNLETSGFLNTKQLEQKCNLFHERAFEIAETELERLENIESEK